MGHPLLTPRLAPESFAALVIEDPRPGGLGVDGCPHMQVGAGLNHVRGGVHGSDDPTGADGLEDNDGALLGDPFGQQWMMSQRIENVSPAEMERRAAVFFEPS
jgi:hypothetical protein